MSLTLENISHSFGKRKFSMTSVSKSSQVKFFALFGPSGCGKTTLLRLGAGLEVLQHGRVALDGETLSAPDRHTPAEARPFGVVFQDYVLFPHMSVQENIGFGLSSSLSRSTRQEKISQQLSALSLDGLAKRYPHELSGGQQQRVAIARALIREPRVLFMDEPFGSIDAVLRRALREELRELLKARGVPVILVTHDPEEALALGDRIALMRAGEILETATPQTLYSEPTTPEGGAIFPGSHLVAGDVRNQIAQTLFGPVPAIDRADGPCRVVIRAAALKAISDKDGAYRFDHYRFDGPGWSVRLRHENGELITVPLTDESELPPPAERFSLNIDQSGVFVF